MLVGLRTRHARRGTPTLFVAAFALTATLLVLTSCDDIFGPGGRETYATPTLVSSSLRFTTITATGHHTCAVAVDGTTYCWGKNEYGELGSQMGMDRCTSALLGDVPCTGTPVAVDGAPRFVHLVGTLGAARTCGLSEPGRAYCWGFGMGGQLGDGSRTNRSTPGPVAGELEFRLLRASTSGDLVCGIAKDGHTYCWGKNWRGMFGNGALDGFAEFPTRVTDELTFETFDLGDSHACGLTAGGKAYCWGSNWYGALGTGSSEDITPTPQPVPGDLRFRSIATGSAHSCGLTLAGKVHCWGSSDAVGSPLGDVWAAEPSPVDGDHTFASIYAGFSHTCGLTAGGEAYCWGQNLGGDLGDGTTRSRSSPAPVRTSIRFSTLAHRPSCGLALDGRAYCWGGNSFGQVGRRGSEAR